jgi:hypothetical protein
VAPAVSDRNFQEPLEKPAQTGPFPLESGLDVQKEQVFLVAVCGNANAAAKASLARAV